MRYLILTAAIGIWFIQQPMKPPEIAGATQADNTHVANQTNDGQQNQQPAAQAAPIQSKTAIPSHSESPSVGHDGQETQTDNHANDPSSDTQWKLVLFTGVLAAVGILQFGTMVWQACVYRKSAHIASRQALEMKHQRLIMRDQFAEMQKQAVAAQRTADAAQQNIDIFISKERARIRVQPQPVDLNQPIENTLGLFVISFDVLIWGLTPAFIFDTAVCADIVDSPTSAVSSLHFPIRELPPVLPPETKEVSCTIFAHPDPMTTDKEVVAGKKIIRLYGFIRYRDVFDIARTSTFRYVWQIDILGVGEWVKDGNGAENTEI